VYVGGGTNEDIYFEDSGVRLYDAGANYLRFYKADYEDFRIFLGNDGCRLLTSGNVIGLQLPAKTLFFYNTGQLQLPNLASLPTSNLADGQLCMYLGILHSYYNSAWHSIA